MCNVPQQAPIGNVPKDGISQCYTSRVLNSTFRFVKFVKRLRAEEEDQRKGAESNRKKQKDQQYSDFFIRCDRRALINNVARRVDLCMASYEDDLNQKRKRLIQLFTLEEEDNIRKFVVQAQAGIEEVWKDKQARLKYLLEKRQKEHEDKYKETPISKCVHVLPCLMKLRAKETADIQQYQIREKAARKMAEREFDNMWHAVVMKESEALKARLEQDAIERFRRDLDCKIHSELQLEQNRIQRLQEREMLKEEAKRFRSMWEEDNLTEVEAERKREEKRKQMVQERDATLAEQLKLGKKLAAEAKVIGDTWDSLASQGLADEKAEVELARKKEKDNVQCNKLLLKQKREFEKLENAGDDIVAAQARAIQKEKDDRLCASRAQLQNNYRDVRKAMVDQITERKAAREVLNQKLADQDEYRRQLFGQLEQLSKLKEKTDAEAALKHQDQLLAQIEYNKTLKERARQEELDQRKKCQLAKEEYQQEIQNMMSRPFFTEDVHPFMKQLAQGLKMRERCPCTGADLCQDS